MSIFIDVKAVINLYIMKQNYFFAIVFFLGVCLNVSSQIASTGDIAFTAFNNNGEKDFAIVSLVDITPNTIVFFSDNNWGGASFTDTEGVLRWDSGGSIIKAGTIIVFTDVKSDSNPAYGSSIGSLTTSNLGFNPTEGGDTVLAFLGSDDLNPTTFLAGYRNATLALNELSGTGLTSGTNFIEVNQTASPNGAYYSGSRSSQISYALYLSLINDKLNWTRNTSNGEATLPISKTGFTISTTNWTGALSTDWNTGGNWTGGVPDNSFAVSIANVVNKPVINSNAILIGNLIIDASSSLTINAGKDLTISGDLTNNGTFSINSDATSSGSLIVTGTATGNITYNRYLTNQWHLIGAPVGGQAINTFATLGANNIGLNGVNYNLAPYDNTLTVGVTTWKKWTTDGTNPVSAAGNFVAGKGYEILTTANGTVAFTGTVAVAQVDIGVTGIANRWNVMGNPFPSSIPSNSNADAINNFLTVNSAALDPSFVAVYLWNPNTSSYDLINQASAATYIAPGQGFFIKAVTGEAGIVNFTTAMRTNQAAVAFQKTATPNIPSIVLSAENNSGKISTTDLKYLGGMSLGLDPGYDAGRFGAANSSFGLYTHLVTDNGVDFAIQAVPENSYDTTVIPIGLDANIGTQVTFKATITNLPLGKKVFLEDRLLNLFTELNNTDKTYTLTLDSQSSGIGRFFLHTQDNLSTLAVADVNKLKFSVIALPLSNQLKLIGMVDEPASLNIYDTLGRAIFYTNLSASNNNEVTIPPLAYGVYIIKVKTAKSNFSTKIAWY